MKRATRSTIDLTALVAAASSDTCGGTSIFVGTVRAGVEDGPIERIEYTAYESMLEAEFNRILTEASERWLGINVRAVHRLGSIPTGEASIAVVVAAPHRAEAFDACEFVVEEAKKRLPVWKKEIFADGRVSWRANRVVAARSRGIRASKTQ